MFVNPINFFNRTNYDFREASIRFIPEIESLSQKEKELYENASEEEKKYFLQVKRMTRDIDIKISSLPMFKIKGLGGNFDIYS